MLVYGKVYEIYPGTILEPQEKLCVDGKSFLHGIFSATKGLMLSQIKEISGIDSPALLNCVDIGYVHRPIYKRYNINQVARILLINMLRSVTKIENIKKLLEFLNGNANDRSDDIIEEHIFYDYICQTIDLISEKEESINKKTSEEELDKIINDVICDYNSPLDMGNNKLKYALKNVILYYDSYILKRYADDYFNKYIN
ncbi:MAG: DUF1836 domain-containing protein [Oscillospiraceae bacterium]